MTGLPYELRDICEPWAVVIPFILKTQQTPQKNKMNLPYFQQKHAPAKKLCKSPKKIQNIRHA
jgi:hypothetical protein